MDNSDAIRPAARTPAPPFARPSSIRGRILLLPCRPRFAERVVGKAGVRFGVWFRCLCVLKGLMLLLERTRTGLRELPSNAAWLLSGALKPADAIRSAADSVPAVAVDRGRRVGAAVLDAAPVGGDSVEIRMRRAQEATERAREAEERAG